MRVFLQRSDRTDDSASDAVTNFLLCTCCTTHKKYNTQDPSLFRKEFCCTETLCLRRKTFSCYGSLTNNFEFDSERVKKRTPRDSGVGPISMYGRITALSVNVTSIKSGYQAMRLSVTTQEQTKNALAYFYTNEVFQQIGNPLLFLFLVSPLKCVKLVSYKQYLLLFFLLFNQILNFESNFSSSRKS